PRDAAQRGGGWRGGRGGEKTPPGEPRPPPPPARSFRGTRTPGGRVETSRLFARRSKAVCIASEATEITFAFGAPNKRLTQVGQTSQMRRLSLAALAAAVVSLLAVAASPSVAHATQPCWHRGIDDWTKDGKIAR